jgi:hypothetical protein
LEEPFIYLSMNQAVPLLEGPGGQMVVNEAAEEFDVPMGEESGEGFRIREIFAREVIGNLPDLTVEDSGARDAINRLWNECVAEGKERTRPRKKRSNCGNKSAERRRLPYCCQP